MQSNVFVNVIHKNCLVVDNMQTYVSTLIFFVYIYKKTPNLTQVLVYFPTDFKIRNWAFHCVIDKGCTLEAIYQKLIVTLQANEITVRLAQKLHGLKKINDSLESINELIIRQPDISVKK